MLNRGIKMSSEETHFFGLRSWKNNFEYFKRSEISRFDVSFLTDGQMGTFLRPVLMFAFSRVTPRDWAGRLKCPLSSSQIGPTFSRSSKKVSGAEQRRLHYISSHSDSVPCNLPNGPCWVWGCWALYSIVSE